jgi:hypothetical protein
VAQELSSMLVAARERSRVVRIMAVNQLGGSRIACTRRRSCDTTNCGFSKKSCVGKQSPTGRP